MPSVGEHFERLDLNRGRAVPPPQFAALSPARRTRRCARAQDRVPIVPKALRQFGPEGAAVSARSAPEPATQRGPRPRSTERRSQQSCPRATLQCRTAHPWLSIPKPRMPVEVGSLGQWTTERPSSLRTKATIRMPPRILNLQRFRQCSAHKKREGRSPPFSFGCRSGTAVSCNLTSQNDAPRCPYPDSPD